MDDFWRDIEVELERQSPSSLAARLDRTRPYTGPPWTDEGDRGRQEIRGVTMRDLADCYVRACYAASGLPPTEWPGSVNDLPDLDPMAVMHALGCEVEKAMGIYPNIPRTYPADPTVPHWCGWPLDNATWTAHTGPCP